MLWISNRGRKASTWNNRHQAIGIEPVRAAFDLGQAIARAQIHLAGQGIPTSWDLVATKPFSTRYIIRASIEDKNDMLFD